MQKLTQKWQKVKNLVVGDRIAVPREEALAKHKLESSLPAESSLPVESSLLVKTGLRPVSVSVSVSGDDTSEVERRPVSVSGVSDTSEMAGDVQWDEIVSIEKVGEERVYDIEVDSTHNFVGNDIFAHNTYLGNLDVEKQTRVNEVDSLKVANVAQDEAINQTDLAVKSLDSRLDTMESTSIAYSAELDKLKQELAALQGSGSAGSAKTPDSGASPTGVGTAPQPSDDTSGSSINPGDMGGTATDGSAKTTDSGASPTGDDTAPNNTGAGTAPPQEVKEEISRQILALDLSEKLQGDVLNNLSVKNMTVLADATFVSDLKVDGHIATGEDTAGEITIKTGAFETLKDANGLPILDEAGNEQPLLDELGEKVPILTAKVEFKKPYAGTPIVTITPVGEAGLDPNFRYAIIEKTNIGFTVKINKAMTQDVKFDWHVFEYVGKLN